MSDDWLKSLKPGDEVAVSCGLGGRDAVIAKIDRITPSGRFVIRRNGRETVFGPDGTERGGEEYYRENLRELTPKIREDVERRALLGRIAHSDLSAFSLDQLRRIDAILREGKP